MNIHRCVFKILGKNQSVLDRQCENCIPGAEIDEYPSLHFKILGKNQSVADRHTNGRADKVKTVYPTTKFAGVIMRLINNEHPFHKKRGP